MEYELPNIQIRPKCMTHRMYGKAENDDTRIKTKIFVMQEVLLYHQHYNINAWLTEQSSKFIFNRLNIGLKK